MDNNLEMCFADKGIGRCSALTEKRCTNCKFRKSVKQYNEDRLKYRDKEIKYLERHGITYIGR